MHGKWVTVAARVYYAVGLSYYLYHWLLLLGAGGFVLGILTHAFHHNFFTFAVAPFSLSLIIWGVVLWSKKRAAQFLSHNPQLHEVLSDTTYTMLGGDKYGFVRRLEVQALYNGVSQYRGKFRWSGGLNVQTIPETSLPDTVTLTRQAHDIHMICQVDFERQLKAGATKKFAYELTMTDTDKVAERFISHTIYYRTDHMVTRVKFNESPNLRYYRKQILASATADIPIWEETVPLDDHATELTWEVKNPRLGYRYKIIW